MTSYADQIETSRRPGGCDLRNCRRFRELLEGHQRSDVIRGSNRDVAVRFFFVFFGGCDLRNCRHLRELLGGTTERRPTHAQTIPRSPSGLPSAQLPPLSRVPGDPAECGLTQIKPTLPPWGAAVATFVSSWEVQRSDILRRSSETSPPWALPTAQLSPLSSAPGRSRGVAPYADQTWPRLPGRCQLRNCRHDRGLLGGPAK